MGYFFKAFLLLTLTTILSCSPTGKNEFKAQTVSVTEEASVPCVNKKNLLGESSDVGIECIPLTRHDREEVLKIDNALKAFEEETVTSISEERFEKEPEDDFVEVEKVNSNDKNHEKIGELKIGENFIPANEDLDEGSGFVDSSIPKIDEVETKVVTIGKDHVPKEETVSPILLNMPEKVLKNEKSPSVNIPLVENETNISMSFSAPKSLSPEEPAETRAVSTANFNFSSAVAGWAAGFFGTFTLIAIGAMCVKNREKKEKKKKKYAVEVIQDEEEALEMT